jgi:hypothetical protein
VSVAGPGIAVSSDVVRSRVTIAWRAATPADDGRSAAAIPAGWRRMRARAA